MARHGWSPSAGTTGRHQSEQVVAITRCAHAGLARAQHNMGVLTLQLGKTDQSIEWFRRAVGGGWRPSAFALGSLLEEQGDRKGAVEAFETGAQQDCPLS